MAENEHEVRNCVLLEDGKRIDCEYNHPDLGWVPFTADPDDASGAGRIIYQSALAALHAKN